MANKIMFFTSQTCSRCRNVKKQIELLNATELFDLVDIESDRGKTLVETYSITSLPTLMYKDNRVETVVLPKVLKDMIDKARGDNA